MLVSLLLVHGFIHLSSTTPHGILKRNERPNYPLEIKDPDPRPPHFYQEMFSQPLNAREFVDPNPNFRSRNFQDHFRNHNKNLLRFERRENFQEFGPHNNDKNFQEFGPHNNDKNFQEFGPHNNDKNFQEFGPHSNDHLDTRRIMNENSKNSGNIPGNGKKMTKKFSPKFDIRTRHSDEERFGRSHVDIRHPRLRNGPFDELQQHIFHGGNEITRMYDNNRRFYPCFQSQSFEDVDGIGNGGYVLWNKRSYRNDRKSSQRENFDNQKLFNSNMIDGSKEEKFFDSFVGVSLPDGKDFSGWQVKRNPSSVSYSLSQRHPNGGTSNVSFNSRKV